MRSEEDPIEHSVCPWCGQHTRLEVVRSHYECMSCHRSVLDCCDGETADE